jgi:hypothetical protein
MQMIDVMKRLADLDTANPSRPEHKVSGNQNITALSESAQVDECGMMPEMGDMGRPSTPASINMTAGSGDELGELIKAIATLAGQSRPAEMEPLSAMPAMGVASDDGMDMRAMIDKLNPMDDEGDEEPKKVDEYDNTPADPTDTNEFDAEEFAHHENPPGAANGRGNMNNPRANTMEQITRNLFADYKKFISEGGVSMPGDQYLSIPADQTKLSIGQQMAQDGITYSPDKEDELIGLMSQYMKKAGMSSKQIRYLLNYDEDYISDQLSDLPKKGMEKETDVAEGGVGDMIINAIEAVRMAKPGLKQQDFLDELYMYIENRNGQRAAEMMSNAGQDEYDEWYDNYLDTAEEGIEDRIGNLDPKNPVNIPAYQRKAASGDSASAARNTKESANESMADILKLSGLK